MEDLKRWPLLDYPEWNNQPLNLTIEEIEEPLLVISAFFDCYKLSESRICLQQWLDDALQREDVDARNLFVLYNNIVRLAEAAWLILQQKPYLSRIGKKGDVDVNVVLELIVSAINPERIFLVTENPIDLLIIMPDKAQKNFKEYEKLVEFALLSQEVITFSVLRSTDLFKHLQNGHFFYSKAAIVNNVVYASNIARELPVESAIPSKRKAEAIGLFNPGFKRAETFFQAAKLHHNHGEKILAAFMLHQTAELGIRALVLGLTGQEIRSHEVSVLRKHCRRYAPALKEVLYSETADRFVTLLDKAYKNARYSPKYEISDDELNLLLKSVALLMNKVEESFNEILGA